MEGGPTGVGARGGQVRNSPWPEIHVQVRFTLSRYGCNRWLFDPGGGKIASKALQKL